MIRFSAVRPIAFRFLLPIIGLALLVSLHCAKAPISATMILINGKVVTVDQTKPEAEAVAIAEGRILAVGTTDEIKQLAGSNTKAIDLEGKLLIPSFIEGHAHLLGLGRSLMRLDLKQTANYDEIVAMVSEAASKAEPGEWILGRGWHQEKWDKTPEPNVDGLPFHHALSEVAPDNPVKLSHASGHALMANAKAMELAGITADMPDPDGGEIVRSRDGELVGVFRENAESWLDTAYLDYVNSWTAEQREAEKVKAIDLATKDCFAKGVTSFHDAGVKREVIDLYRKLAEDNRLGLRVWAMLGEENDSLRGRLDEYRMIGVGNDHLTVRAIKRVIDGALGSHGAWLLEPYVDLPSSSGLPTVSPDSLATSARLAAEHGFQLCTHAIGDRGNRETLDVYEAVFENNPDKSDWRWRIEHAQHLNAKDIPRFASLGVMAAMQGVHCTSDGPWVPKRIGEARAEEGAYVWQKLLVSGATVANGTDAPVEDVSPLECFYSSVTRMMNNGEQFYPAQCMSRKEALKSYTFNNAYLAFEEEIKGSITPGKLADLVVLSNDIMTIPAEEILKTKVIYTIVGGEIVYQAK